MNIKNSIAIIPARGGSKRIKNKNIKNFCGYPIISYAIKTAIKTKLFKKIIVSTDDKEIMKVALKYGAEVPFLRPQALSKDHTGIAEVVKHAVDKIRGDFKNLFGVCCIFATTPLLSAKDIKKSYEIFKEKNGTMFLAHHNFITH